MRGPVSGIFPNVRDVELIQVSPIQMQDESGSYYVRGLRPVYVGKERLESEISL